jgi:hypothetical protein
VVASRLFPELNQHVGSNCEELLTAGTLPLKVPKRPST